EREVADAIAVTDRDREEVASGNRDEWGADVELIFEEAPKLRGEQHDDAGRHRVHSHGERVAGIDVTIAVEIGIAIVARDASGEGSPILTGRKSVPPLPAAQRFARDDHPPVHPDQAHAALAAGSLVAAPSVSGGPAAATLNGVTRRAEHDPARVLREHP